MNPKPDIGFLCEILPSLPKEYIENAINLTLDSNIPNCIDYLMELNEIYPQCITGEKYKVYRCGVPDCKMIKCPFYHKSKDRRRDLAKFDYDSRPCYAVNKNGIWNDPELCKKGDKCNFSHNSQEMEFHPKHYQPTRRPNEEVKRESYPSESIQNLANKLNQCKAEIRELQKEIDEKHKQLESVDQEIFSIKGIVLCSHCGNSAYDWILSCGHLICHDCKKVIIDRCSVCNTSVSPKDIILLK